MRPREEGDAAYLDDILTSCSLIVSRVESRLLPDFVSNLELQDSILHRLIIIGEASKKVSEHTKKKFPELDWRDIARLRDLSVHRYWKIDALKIWKIVQEDVPQLLEILAP